MRTAEARRDRGKREREKERLVGKATGGGCLHQARRDGAAGEAERRKKAPAKPGREREREPGKARRPRPIEPTMTESGEWGRRGRRLV